MDLNYYYWPIFHSDFGYDKGGSEVIYASLKSEVFLL